MFPSLEELNRDSPQRQRKPYAQSLSKTKGTASTGSLRKTTPEGKLRNASAERKNSEGRFVATRPSSKGEESIHLLSGSMSPNAKERTLGKPNRALHTQSHGILHTANKVSGAEEKSGSKPPSRLRSGLSRNTANRSILNTFRAVPTSITRSTSALPSTYAARQRKVIVRAQQMEAEKKKKKLIEAHEREKKTFTNGKGKSQGPFNRRSSLTGSGTKSTSSLPPKKAPLMRSVSDHFGSSTKLHQSTSSHSSSSSISSPFTGSPTVDGASSPKNFQRFEAFGDRVNANWFIDEEEVKLKKMGLMPAREMESRRKKHSEKHYLGIHPGTAVVPSSSSSDNKKSKSKSVEYMSNPYYSLPTRLGNSGLVVVLDKSIEEIDPTGEGVHMFLQTWLERYMEEDELFGSPLLFCEVKMKELFEITKNLSHPHPFRTWVSCDLLMKLVECFPTPETRKVISKVVEVLLSAIYSDQGTTCVMCVCLISLSSSGHLFIYFKSLFLGVCVCVCLCVCLPLSPLDCKLPLLTFPASMFLLIESELGLIPYSGHVRTLEAKLRQAKKEHRDLKKSLSDVQKRVAKGTYSSRSRSFCSPTRPFLSDHYCLAFLPSCVL